MQTHKHRSVSSWGQSLCHPHFCGSNHQWLICQLLGVKGYRPNGQKVKGLVNNRPDSSKQTYIVYQGKKSDFWRESFRFISKCNCFLICNRNSCYFGLCCCQLLWVDLLRYQLITCGSLSRIYIKPMLNIKICNFTIHFSRHFNISVVFCSSRHWSCESWKLSGTLLDSSLANANFIFNWGLSKPTSWESTDTSLLMSDPVITTWYLL